MEDYVVVDPLTSGIKYTFHHLYDQNNRTDVIISGLQELNITNSSNIIFDIIFIRHGETKKNCVKYQIMTRIPKNRENTLVSKNNDYLNSIQDSGENYEFLDIMDKNSELNDRGVSQAHEFGRYINNSKDYRVCRIITSGLTRTVQTGQIISDILDIQPEINTDLHFDNKVVQIRATRLIRFIAEI